MRISVLILSVAVLAIAVTSAVAEGGRSERSIRDWFSGLFKRFQKKGNRRQPYYLRPSYPTYYSSSYGGSASNSYGTSFQQPHRPSFDSGVQSYGGQDVGIGGGHGVEGGVHSSSGHGGGASYGSGVGGGGGGHAPSGFGPLKSSDVISHGSGGGAPIHEHGHGAHEGPHITQGHAVALHNVDDSYQPPHQEPEVQHLPHADLSPELDHGPSYIPPSNSISSILPSKGQYIPPQQNNLPVEPKSVDISLDDGYVPPIQSNHFQLSSASNSFAAAVPQPSAYTGNSRDIVVDGRYGGSVYAPDLGPNDPIVEIVFQQGDPLPPPPPPVIDESYFTPAKDEVEVFFIEYSGEDKATDLHNLDLTGAQPAILQNLPNELPYELRSHLINSGVLENAHIEIIDLDDALEDDTLDYNTRSALRQAYSRNQRQVSAENYVSPPNDEQAVDIRVQRLNHDSKTPEGIVEFLSGLKAYRKGTYAGLVEVNDDDTNKYLPVTIDGNTFPLPDSIPLENKKVDGVLVLAPEQEKKKRQPKATFTSAKSLQLSSSAPRAAVLQNKQRRLLEIDWADMDTNGWIPIVNVDT